MIEITTAATDRTLLSLTEARVAAGLASTDTSQDATIETLRARISATLARECGVVTDGVTPATLRQETITETVRLAASEEHLLLSRLPIVSITSITEDGIALDTDEFETNRGTGQVWRLDSDTRIYWPAVKVTIVYVAGWATVPDDLKLAASRLVSDFYSAGTRDPNLRRIRIEGQSEREYWVAPTSDPAISQEVLDLIAPYRQNWIG